MRIEKGAAGYIKSQQRIRTVRTIALFALVFAVFAVGMILNKGDRRSIYSIVAAVGCIPAAMSAVSMIMMWLRKPVPAVLAREIRKQAGDVRVLFEMYITMSESGLYLYAAAVRDSRVAAYAPEYKNPALLHTVAAYLKNTLSQSCGYTEVTITGQLEEFEEQLAELAQTVSEDPDLEEQIAGNLLALSL